LHGKQNAEASARPEYRVNHQGAAVLMAQVTYQQQAKEGFSPPLIIVGIALGVSVSWAGTEAKRFSDDLV
jgi:hypothetical protein